MPRNGSGVYTLPVNGFNPAVPNANILSTDWNSTAADLAQAISESISTLGTTTATARIPFAAGAAISVGTAASPGLVFIGDTDTGLFQGAVGQIGIASNGTPVWTFLTNGDLAAAGASGQIIPAGGTAAAPALTFQSDTDTGVYRPGVNRLGFATAGTARWEINAVGDIFPTAGTHGIYLGGTAAANLLARYETGTFTPTVSFATPGTSSFVYTVQSGTYRRVGDLVAFNVRLDFTPTIGTGSGQININGLPFTSGAERQAVTIGYLDRLTTFQASATMVHARIIPSATSFFMAFAGPAVAPASVAASNITSGTAMSWLFSGTYYV